MRTFEEEFPSLKELSIDCKIQQLPINEKNINVYSNLENDEHYYDTEQTAYLEDDIQEYCVDKQRVREAIDKYYSYEGGTTPAFEEFLKELDL